MAAGGRKSTATITASLNVYFVRHAESDNNKNKHHDQDAMAEKAEPNAKKPRTSKPPREPDPALSDRGLLQSKACAHFFSRLCEDPKTDPSLVPGRLYTSGFKRSVQTCRPLADALGLQPELAAETFEEGGVFFGSRSEGLQPGQPLVHGLNAEGMSEILPALRGLEDVPTRGWWRGGLETSEETAARAQACTEWLWSLCRERASSRLCAGPEAANGAEAPTENADKAIVLVTHGLFLDRWLKAILGIPPLGDHAAFLTANCAYWLVRLRLTLRDAAGSTSEGTPKEESRKAALMACNVVDHVPMDIRTGHSMGLWNHMPPSYYAPKDEEERSSDDTNVVAMK